MSDPIEQMTEAASKIRKLMNNIYATCNCTLTHYNFTDGKEPDTIQVGYTVYCNGLSGSGRTVAEAFEKAAETYTPGHYTAQATELRKQADELEAKAKAMQSA